MPPNINKTSTYRQAISDFDDLPDSAFVSIAVVCTLQGCSPATAWRQVRAGILPAPRKIGARMTRFNVGQLRKFLGAE